MAGKREKPEEIVSKLRRRVVSQGQSMIIADAKRLIRFPLHPLLRCPILGEAPLARFLNCRERKLYPPIQARGAFQAAFIQEYV